MNSLRTLIPMSISNRVRMPSIPFRLRNATMTLCLLSFLGLAGSLQARDFEVSILPFRVSGSVPEQYFSRKALPVELQRATAFLFELHKNYPVDSIERLNRSLPVETLVSGALPGQDYCNYTRGAYLLKGEAVFSGTRGITITMELQSCNTGRTVQKATGSGSLNDLQTLLVESIQRSTPGFRSSDLPAWSGSSVEWILVMDQSGSMSGEKLALARALKSLDASGLVGRMGLLLVGENGNRLVEPGSAGEAISILEGSGTGGEVSLSDVARALQTLQRLPPAERKVLIVTDAGSGSTAEFEGALRSLLARGSHPVLIPTSGMPATGRTLYARLNRSLKLQDPEIIYGRRAGFIEGFSLFFVQKGDRFYVSRKDVSRFIEAGNLPADQVSPVATVNLRDDSLTLSSVIQSFAKKENLKLLGTGPLISSLENSLASMARGNGQSGHRVLLKNQGTAFWINCNSSTATNLRKYRGGQKIYVGLMLKKGPLGPENHPEMVLIRSAADVPSLFIQRYDDLSSEKLLKKQDIWFFLVEVVDIR
ncbi:MAG: VWA domain-containing protein [Leptospiraceae bacterium]|nr:VWA domain-containing protein [Leptospiraceae bacterium]